MFNTFYFKTFSCKLRSLKIFKSYVYTVKKRNALKFSKFENYRVLIEIYRNIPGLKNKKPGSIL